MPVPAPSTEPTDVVDAAARLLVPVDVRATEDDDAGNTPTFGAPSATDLRLINKLALDRLSADEVFAFRAAISNTLVDSYFTHMATSSLRNYVQDAKRGIAVMNSHRTGGWGRTLELAIGRSYTAELTRDGDLSTVTAAAYMRRGSTSNGYSVDSVIEDIRAGIISDVSIGFHGGRWVCDSCGRDFFSYDCPHWPGFPDEDGELVTVTVENANLSEFSLVYDGATPGAAISRMQHPTASLAKAQRMAHDGVLSGDAIRLIEGQLHQRITNARSFPVPRLDAPTHATPTPATPGTATTPPTDRQQQAERTDDMTGAELIAGVLANSGETIPEDARARLDGLRTQMEATGGSALDAARALAALAQPPADAGDLDTLRARVAELEPEAADGRAYRQTLVTETLAWGVRAYGADFQEDLYTRLLREPTRSIEDIRAIQEGFRKRATERLGPGGRQTAPLDPNDPTGLLESTGPARTRNASAYSA